jgi:predicted transcriptional regulator
MIGILKSCVTDGLSISRLMSLHNLPHSLLSSCLHHLVSAELVESVIDDGRKYVRTTEKGLVALRCYKNAIALLNGLQATCPLAGELAERPIIS